MITIPTVAVAIAVVITVTLIARSKVAVREDSLTHSRHSVICLIKDPAKPSLPAAIHWTIQVCGQGPFGCTGR